jgi:hypothetical protein
MKSLKQEKKNGTLSFLFMSVMPIQDIQMDKSKYCCVLHRLMKDFILLICRGKNTKMFTILLYNM